MAVNINLKDDLQKMDDEFGDSMYRMFGLTNLGFPEDTDSSRLYMFTSHLKQTLCITNPDVPHIMTGFENTFGKYNRAYKFFKGTWEVIDIIYKYGKNGVYTVVLYNAETETYDMIEKTEAENLTEKFGYLYNTDRMDELKIGDRITDECLYKSTSYDAHMNYRYGKNAKVYYSTSNDTLEDAFVVRRGWAEQVKSVEVDDVFVVINDNDVPLNLYGTEEEYRFMPDIGERVINSTLCATRRINKDHLLYDFQSQNMRKIYSTDTDYYVSKDSIIYDIDIYYNGQEPFPDNIFFRQIKYYYDMQCKYAERILEVATKIKESGKHYTLNVSMFIDRYQHFNDPEYKWVHREKGRAFSNMLIEFKVRSLVSLDYGSKITGRYGDKGVISRISDPLQFKVAEAIMGDMEEYTEEELEKVASKITIVDDGKMPYTDKFPIDILANMSGSTRRLNPGQLYETELTFIGNEIVDHMKTLPTLEEKAAIAFKFISMVNESEYKFFYEMYESYDKIVNINGHDVRLLNRTEQEMFIKDIEEHGFYIVKPPQSNIRYEKIKELYEEFDFIKPLPIYIDIFGTTHRRVILDGVIGDKYILILKQNSNKNFSARSTFRVNRSNLPTKDTTKRNNRFSYSRSPIKLSEIYNLLSSISGRTLAEHNIFTRSSMLGRKSLDRILAAPGNPLNIKKLKVKQTFTNTNAEILNAKLKAIGIRLVFSRDKDNIPDVFEDVITPMSIAGFTVYDSPLRNKLYIYLFEERRKFLSDFYIVESYPGEKEDIAWQHVFDLPKVKEYNLDEETKKMLIATTKGEYKPPEVVEEIK